MISHVALEAMSKDTVMVRNACTPLDRACPVIERQRGTRKRGAVSEGW